MRRPLVVPTLLAIAIAVECGWAQLTSYLWSDYELANEVPLRSLVHGHLSGFFQTAPIEGPSLLLRTPFALMAWVWGGSDMAVYLAWTLPAMAVLAYASFRRPRSASRRATTRASLVRAHA